MQELTVSWGQPRDWSRGAGGGTSLYYSPGMCHIRVVVRDDKAIVGIEARPRGPGTGCYESKVMARFPPPRRED